MLRVSAEQKIGHYSVQSAWHGWSQWEYVWGCAAACTKASGVSVLGTLHGPHHRGAGTQTQPSPSLVQGREAVLEALIQCSTAVSALRDG